MASALVPLNHVLSYEQRKMRSSQARIEDHRDAPVSFHLALLLGNQFTFQTLPENIFHGRKNSVAVLRLPFENFKANQYDSTNTKERMIWVLKGTEKASEAWQEKLLLVTERRMFLISKTETAPSDAGEGVALHDEVSSRESYEIAESIPMEEIRSIQFCSESKSWSEENTSTAQPKTLAAKFLAVMDSLLQSLVGDITEDKLVGRPKLSATDRAAFERGLWESMPENAHEYYPRMLRITTVQSGFNLGQDYYFLLKKGDYPYFRTSDVMDTRRLEDEKSAAEFERKLARLAAKYREAFYRKTRFTRLQQKMHKVRHPLLPRVCVGGCSLPCWHRFRHFMRSGFQLSR